MNADDVLKYGHLQVLRSLDHLPDPATWDVAGVCGWWSVRQILAHLTSYERLLADILEGILGRAGGATLARYLELGPERFNDDEVAARDGHSPAAVLADYDAAQSRSRDLLGQIPVARRREAGILPWYGIEYDLEDLLAYQYYGHKREHTAQIDVYSDAVDRKTG